MSQQFDRIASFVENPQVPKSARAMGALLLVDTLAVAAGAVSLAPARIARDFASSTMCAAEPADQAPMLFDGRRVSVPGAAFAAATQIDNLDGHDGYNPTKGHIGCAVVPALLAFAARKPDLTSQQALDILVMSYEIGARAARALHRTVTDYHTSGAWNALAVAAIGCRLRDASRTQLREALGIAEYHGPRSQMMREIAHPTMLHDGSGMGALTGSMAALLAVQGFQGAPALTVEAPEVADIWADLGQDWTIERNYIKPYPVCRWAHAPLDGLAGLMQTHSLTAADIKHLQVRTFAESTALFAGLPRTTSEAQYSLPFALAAMMAHGRVGPREVTGAGLENPAVTELIGRISVIENPAYSSQFPARRCADVILTLQDETILESGTIEARGGPDAPLSEAEIEDKLHIFAAPTLGPDRAAALWQMRRALLTPGHRFEDLADVVRAAPTAA